MSLALIFPLMLPRTILMAGALQAFFFALLLVRKAPKHKGDQYLLIWILLIGFNLLFFYDATANTPTSPLLFQILGFYLPLLHAPVLFAYLHQVTVSRRLRLIELLLHGIPYYLGICCLLFYHYYPDSTLSFQQGFTYLEGADPLGLYPFLGIPIAISACSYALAGLLLLNRYQQQLPNLHANPELVSLSWFQYLTVAALIFFCLVFLIIQLGPSTSLIGSDQVFLLVGILTTVYVFCFGYFGLRQRVLLPIITTTQVVDRKSPAASYSHSGLHEAAAQLLFQQLEKHMVEQEAFLDEQLTLPGLAAQLACPPNHLSQVINQYGKNNFFAYVNTYRVAAIKKKLLDPTYDHFTILALALDCGFGSKASFNKTFKGMTGVTPSAFRKKRG